MPPALTRTLRAATADDPAPDFDSCLVLTVDGAVRSLPEEARSILLEHVGPRRPLDVGDVFGPDQDLVSRAQTESPTAPGIIVEKAPVTVASPGLHDDPQ